MTNVREELLQLLAFEGYEYSEDPFTLKSGRQSQHYVDCRRVLLSAHGRMLAGRLMMDRHPELLTATRAIAGVALGGIPFASAVAERTLRSLIYVRPEAKAHGRGGQVEAAYDLGQGMSVLLMEDVVTTGGSTIAAIDALEAANFRIHAVVALVDREEGGADVVSARTRFVPVYTLTEIAKQ